MSHPPIPTDRRYTRTHEWFQIGADGFVTVGITDYAQSQLGDMVFVALPELQRAVAAAEACSVVESVKAASDVYSPLAGTVVEVNEALFDHPELINQNPYDQGWLFRLRCEVLEELPGLDAKAYGTFIAEQEDAS